MTVDKRTWELTPESCRGLKNLYLTTGLGHLDCLGEITGVGSYEEVRAGAVSIELEGGAVAVVDIEKLIRAKRAL